MADGTLALTPLIRVDGAAFSAEWLGALIELRVELEFQVPGRVTLRVADPGYALLSGGTLALGHEIKVADPAHPDKSIITAEITSVGAEQRPGEQPEVVIVALDKSHRLGRATRVDVFKQMTYSDMVARIAPAAGLRASCDATDTQYDYLMQAESDLALITELARRTGYDWWVSDQTLNFKKPHSSGEVHLVLGEQLRSFSARASGLTPSSVVVDGWDRAKQQQISATASSASTPVAKSHFAGLAGRATTAFGASTVMTGALGAQSVAEASRLAQSVLDRAASAAVTAKGVASGSGTIALGVTVNVDGAGPLSGSYPVTAVEHIYRPATGFVTRFSSGERRPTSMVDTLKGGGAYSGAAHSRAGVTVGKVTNIKDPDDRGRVCVRFPGVSEGFETGWGRVVYQGGGKSRGAVWIPEVDDEVLIAFEGGDARLPVVIGGLYGEVSTMPTTAIKDGKVQARGLTSRLGHSIMMKDGTDDSEQAIAMALAGGQHEISMSKKKLVVKVPSGLPVEITAGSTSLKFSDSGDVTIEGQNITIKANQAFKVEANSEASVKSQGQLELQAQAMAKMSSAIIEIQSQGPAKLAGTPVQIN